MSYTIGIIREEKQPVDKRTPLTPEQCRELLTTFPTVRLVVQPSPHRCYTDASYADAGITLSEDLSNCDLLLGIKEVPKEKLIAGKSYVFFSHTIKKQPYNQAMLQEILRKKITLLDYEKFVWENGSRIIGFGRFAGIVGTHNGLLAWGKKYKQFEVKAAYQSFDYAEVLGSYKNVKIPSIKIAVCGDGRVAHGSLEFLQKLGVREVTSRAFIHEQFDEPVYVHLRPDHLYESNDYRPFDKSYFYHAPEGYFSVFSHYYPVCDLMINAIYWSERIPRYFSLEEMQSPDFKVKVIADITCDINGSVPCTVRATPIEEPVFGWNRFTKKEEAPYQLNTVDVMAVSNLPCELPRDASEEFGELLAHYVLPLLIEGDKEGILERATITHNGSLTPKYAYLQDYADGK